MVQQQGNSWLVDGVRFVSSRPECHRGMNLAMSILWLDWAKLYDCYWLEEHGDIVCRWDRIGYHPFQSLNWVFGVAGLAHEVWTHATWHGWILECSFGDHGLDGEGYPCEIEVTTDDLFADQFDHLFACRTHLLDLYFVCTDLPSLRIGMLMPVLVLVGKKTV